VKIAIVSDLHLGVKNDNPFFLEESLKYFEEQFFPYLKEHKINTVIHIGDLMDRRKYVNFNTLHQIKRRLFDKMQDLEIDFWTTLGNHDVYYKNTNEVESTGLLFNEYLNLHVVRQPTVVPFDNLKIGIVPWITNDNEKDCMDFIQSSKCSILMGHFEINGFEVVSGIYHSHGVEKNVFSKYEKVLSGHFHIRQTKANIHYVGTPYQMSFGDVVGKKGFNVLDTSTRELEFVENKRRVFHVIKYDDVNGFDPIDQDEIRNCFVKVLVINKKKQKVFDKFIDILYSCELQELTVIEEIERNEDDGEEIDMSEDTISIIAKEIDIIDSIKDKQKMKTLIKEIYMESITYEQ